MAEVFTFENGKQVCFGLTIIANGTYVLYRDYELLDEERRAVRDQLDRAENQIDKLKEYIAKLEKTRGEWDDKAKNLKCELDKTYNQLMETEKDAQERIAELESELEVKDNLLKINLNDIIKVKLTPYGSEIYYKQFDDVNKQYGKEICKPQMPQIDKDGYTEFQLWHFIELYGQHIGMCKPNVIEPLEIVYCGNDKCHSDNAE